MKKILMILAFCLMITPAHAAQWKLDPGHSAVMFGIKHIFSEVRGVFHDLELDMEFDPARPGLGRIALTVKTKSVNTFNQCMCNTILKRRITPFLGGVIIFLLHSFYRLGKSEQSLGGIVPPVEQHIFHMVQQFFWNFIVNFQHGRVHNA